MERGRENRGRGNEEGDVEGWIMQDEEAREGGREEGVVDKGRERMKEDRRDRRRVRGERVDGGLRMKRREGRKRQLHTAEGGEREGWRRRGVGEEERLMKGRKRA